MSVIDKCCWMAEPGVPQVSLFARIRSCVGGHPQNVAEQLAHGILVFLPPSVAQPCTEVLWGEDKSVFSGGKYFSISFHCSAAPRSARRSAPLQARRGVQGCSLLSTLGQGVGSGTPDSVEERYRGRRAERGGRAAVPMGRGAQFVILIFAAPAQHTKIVS